MQSDRVSGFSGNGLTYTESNGPFIRMSSDYNHKEGTLTITDITSDMINWTRDKVATINRGCGAAPVGFHANR